MLRQTRIPVSRLQDVRVKNVARQKVNIPVQQR